MVHGLMCTEMGLRRGLGGWGELGRGVHPTMQMEGAALGGAVRLGDEWGWIPRRHLMLASTGQAPHQGVVGASDWTTMRDRRAVGC